ncbi:TetR/AcrR family transcriptional regulator [Paraburkholderia sp. ZP32-5]|uniref:TetR/AcrR family transcriptional regulator n=1 Tax=Paraburkholderia sp. ZP32-5 TaxID=2883245 RepID=UPI001F3A65D1|nr:TetR/AcrR family transcriptional regulator [Paraburkholderia sp. ZP32-5]
MAQVKKTEVRDAILAAAFDLFCRKGYSATTMAEIARVAGTTVSNLYIYFDSKLTVLYEINTPWLLRQIHTLAEQVQKFRTPETRLRRIFLGIWRDIPQADHSFANAMIEALAGAPEGASKPNNLLSQAETLLTQMIIDSLPPERRHIAESKLLSHIIWMAFDGFVINQRIGDIRDGDALADLMIDLLLGENT